LHRPHLIASAIGIFAKTARILPVCPCRVDPNTRSGHAAYIPNCRMGRIMRVLLIVATAIAMLSSPATAQIFPGKPFTGEVDGRFLGEVISLKAPGVYVIEVELDGAFATGIPFAGKLFLDIETTQTLTVGEAIRGRVRAMANAQVTDYSDAGLKFSADASTVDYDWETIQHYGSTSKQGGTSIFRLEPSDIIFSFGGTSKQGGTSI
jgi:hypothetical protein